MVYHSMMLLTTEPMMALRRADSSMTVTSSARSPRRRLMGTSLR